MTEPLNYSDGRDGVAAWVRATMIELPFSLMCLDPRWYPVDVLVSHLRSERWNVVELVVATTETEVQVTRRVSEAIQLPWNRENWDTINSWLGTITDASPVHKACFVIRVDGEGDSPPLLSLFGVLLNNIRHYRLGLGEQFLDGTIGHHVLSGLWVAKPESLAPGADHDNSIIFRGAPPAPR